LPWAIERYRKSKQATTEAAKKEKAPVGGITNGGFTAQQ